MCPALNRTQHQVQRSQPPSPPRAAGPILAHPKHAKSATFRVPRDKDNALSLLRANGFTRPRFVGLPRDSSLTFDADNRADCPCCSLDHDRQHWHLSEDRQGYLHARSYSERCRTLKLQAPVLDPTAIRQRLEETVLRGTWWTFAHDGGVVKLDWSRARLGGRVCSGVSPQLRDVLW